MDKPSITNQPVFKPKTNRKVTMEDLRSATVAFYSALEKRGVMFETIEDEDKFHDSLYLFLEESFDWPDYTSFN